MKQNSLNFPRNHQTTGQTENQPSSSRPDLNIDQAFDRFHRAHPEVMHELVQLADMAKRAVEIGAPAYPLIRGVCPGWDNTARRPGRGTVFHRATPQSYQRWLSLACEYARQHPVSGSRLVFINAWNEWA